MADWAVDETVWPAEEAASEALSVTVGPVEFVVVEVVDGEVVA